jgi:signal transduction histidine kinase
LGLFAFGTPFAVLTSYLQNSNGGKMQLIEKQLVEAESEQSEILNRKNFPDLFRKMFLSAPTPMAVLDAKGSVLPNAVCKDYLMEYVGPNPSTWQPWLWAAAARLMVNGSWRDTVAGLADGRPELELTLGPEVTRDGHRVLTLRRISASESRTDDLSTTVSTLYHELRTPLTSMKSSLNLVCNGDTGPLNEDQSHFLGMTMRNIERMDRLVGDLLDVSRAATGNLVLNPVEADLCPVLCETLEIYGEAARAAGLEFDTGGLSSAVWVRVDQDKVVQMLSNVVDNAVKFTPSGGKIQVLVEEDPADGNFSIVVRDTGPGMDESALAQVFEPFKRVHDEHECRVPGSGLGLHITRGLARAHGGNLELASEPGTGTTVRIVLPRGMESTEDANSV